MSDQLLELLLSFERGETVDLVLEDYSKYVIHGETRKKYSKKIQTGKKEGESLYAHVMNGICVLETLRPYLALSEQEARILYTAFTIHDLNKVTEGHLSFNRIALKERVREEIQKLELGAFYPDWEAAIEDITTLIRSHGGHSSVGGEALIVKNEPRYLLGLERVTALISLMRAADVIGLSKTLQERAHKGTFVSDLNRYLADSGIPTQYELHSVQIAEQRGVLTNVILNAVGAILENRGWIKLLLYAEGTVYLAPKGTDSAFSPEFLTELGRGVDDRLRAIISGNPADLIEQTAQGIKFTPNALTSGLPFDVLFGEVRVQVSRRKFKVVDLEANARKRLEKDLPKLAKRNPNLAVWFTERLADSRPFIHATDDQLRAAELARTYYILLNDYFKEVVSDAWAYLYRLLELPLDNDSFYDCFEPRYDRPYVLAGDLRLSEDEVYTRLIEDGAQRFQSAAENASESSEVDLWTDYLTRYMAFDGQLATSTWADHLTHYVENQHGQCVHCSSPFEVVGWRTSDVRDDIAIQKFSNRLLGGVRGEPIKSICKVCRTQFLIEMLNYPSIRNETVYYLHIMPRTYQTPPFMQHMAKIFRSIRNIGIDVQAGNMNLNAAFEQLRAEKPLTPALATQTKAGKAHPYGIYIPKYSESLAGTLIMPINAPGENDTEKYLFALWYALILGKFYEANVILSKDPVPPLNTGDVPALYLDSAPLACVGLLRHNAYELSNSGEIGIDWLLEQANHLFDLGHKLSPLNDEKPALVRAMTAGSLYLFYTADRLIEAQENPFLARDIFMQVRDLAIAIGGRWMSDVSIMLDRLAGIAWEGRLRGKTLERSSLLYPLGEVFAGMAKIGGPLDRETLIAATVQFIFDHVERISDDKYKPGEKVYAAAEEFVRGWYDGILKEAYQNNATALLRDEKLLRAAYLFYIQSKIPQKSK